MIPQLVVHVCVVKMCSEQIYGVFLGFIFIGTSSVWREKGRLARKKRRVCARRSAPIGSNFRASFLFSGSSVNRDYLRPRGLDHLRVLQSRLQIVIHANLRRDGHRQLLVQFANQRFHRLPIVHQIRPVIPSLGDPLRTSKVNIHPIAIRRDHHRRLEQHVRIVGAKLRQERPIARRRAKNLSPILWRLDEQSRVNHRRVPQRRPVPSTQLSKRQFALIHHGRDVKPRRAHRLEKRKPSALGVASRRRPRALVRRVLDLGRTLDAREIETKLSRKVFRRRTRRRRARRLARSHGLVHAPLAGGGVFARAHRRRRHRCVPTRLEKGGENTARALSDGVERHARESGRERELCATPPEGHSDAFRGATGGDDWRGRLAGTSAVNVF